MRSETISKHRSVCRKRAEGFPAEPEWSRCSPPEELCRPIPPPLPACAAATDQAAADEGAVYRRPAAAASGRAGSGAAGGHSCRCVPHVSVKHMAPSMPDFLHFQDRVLFFMVQGNSLLCTALISPVACAACLAPPSRPLQAPQSVAAAPTLPAAPAARGSCARTRRPAAPNGCVQAHANLMHPLQAAMAAPSAWSASRATRSRPKTWRSNKRRQLAAAARPAAGNMWQDGKVLWRALHQWGVLAQEPMEHPQALPQAVSQAGARPQALAKPVSQA